MSTKQKRFILPEDEIPKYWYNIQAVSYTHLIFKDISTFYNGKVIGVNVDNKENREKKRGRAMLIENNQYFVVGDKGIQRQLE